MIRRRVLAAMVLLAFALGSALFWNGGEADWVAIGVNMAIAVTGFVALHYRWRSKERRSVEARDMEDVFS